MTAQEAARLVPSPIGQNETRFSDGNTDDIITTILEVDAECATRRDLKALAQRLRGATDFETCRNIWYFIKREIPYKADENGNEQIRFPNRAISDAAKGKGCDCKSFAVLTADLLRENNIDGFFVFISQTWQKKPTHVYCKAKLKNGQIVVLDAVYHVFNGEPRKVHEWKEPISKRTETTNSIGKINRSTVLRGVRI